jgi:hypothetical protein
MGDIADDMWDESYAEDVTRKFCDIHKIFYSSANLTVDPVCPACEFGEPSAEDLKRRKEIQERLVKWDGKE